MNNVDFNKISVILKNEYSLRIKRKSFLILSIITPILYGLLLLLPTIISRIENKTTKTIVIFDENKIIAENFPKTENISFLIIDSLTPNELKTAVKEKKYWGLLYIQKSEDTLNYTVDLYSLYAPNISSFSYLKVNIENKINGFNIYRKNEKIINKPNIKLNSIPLDQGELLGTSIELLTVISIFLSILIYIFILRYSSLVSNSIIDDKRNKIIELLVSSVRPFELIMGKILGIATVGFTQFLIWIILSILILTTYNYFDIPGFDISSNYSEYGLDQSTHNNKLYIDNENEIISQVNLFINTIKSMNINKIVFCFLFYFLFGYLLYSSLFATLGAMSNNSTNIQSFTNQLTLPLILGLIVSFKTMSDSYLSVALSIFPLTSPIVMIARLPFGVPNNQLIISFALLIITFLLFALFASNVYKTGILLYGKKKTLTEILKWWKY